MTVERIGVNGMTLELMQFYDKKLLSVAELDLQYMKFGVKRPIPAGGGKSIDFRRFEKVTVTAGASYTLTEGTAPAETQGTVSHVAATISQYGMFMKLSDILQTQAYDPVIAGWVEKFGTAMAEGLDIVVRDTLSAATNIQYADSATVVGTSGAGAVGSGNYLDAAEILEARRTLRRAGARQAVEGKYICFIHPDNTYDLMQDPDIVDTLLHAAPQGASNPLFTGMVGDWQGVRFIENNNVRVRSSYGMSGADIYEILMFGNEYYGVTELSAQSARMIIHPLGSGGHTDPLEQYSTIGWKAALAACILNQSFGLLINVASSRSPSA